MSSDKIKLILFYRVKANNSNLKVDLYVNGELLDQNDDRKLISQVPIRDKTVSLHSLLALILVCYFLLRPCI